MHASEVKIISRLRHRNLEQFMGWCHKKRELLLVYELMPNGNLNSCPLEEKTKGSVTTEWKERKNMKKILGNCKSLYARCDALF